MKLNLNIPKKQEESVETKEVLVPEKPIDSTKATESNATPTEQFTIDTSEFKEISELLDNIVENALKLKASDIHIEPKIEYLLVRYRLDGILQDIKRYDKKYEEPLIFKIKVNARLRTDEHFAPQDGRISFPFAEKLDTRISIIPTSTGEKVVIRLLTQGGRSFSLEALGFRARDLEIVRKNILKPYGTILSAGPTGSGKTTSLYSILKELNSRDVNITTIEDPIEYEISGVNHVQINTKAGLTFEKGLRALLRQDPDVLMVGEIRDSETAEIAINAAMTGHLVLSTIHTNDAITTVPRLIDMGVEPFLVASALNVVMAQRLARKLCDKCKIKVQLSAQNREALKKFRPDLFVLLKEGEVMYQAKGCSECGSSGYKGRVGLFEIFEVTEDVRKIILENADTDKIFDIAREQGLTLIVEDGVLKIREGLIDLQELLRVTALKQ